MTTSDPLARVRVVHVIASLAGYGAERFVARLLPRLPEHGVDASALTVYTSKFGNGSSAPENVAVFDAARRGRYDAGFFGRMVHALRQRRPDIVHTHTHNGKYWGRLAAIMAGVPAIVHTEHDPNFASRGAERIADAWLGARTRRFVAFSDGHRDRLAIAEGISPDKISVIPNGIAHRYPAEDARDRGRAAFDVAAGEKIVVIIGRLEEQKNHAAALRGFAALEPAQRDRVRLFVIGDGSLAATLRSLVDELHLEQRVTFMGLRSDVPDLLAATDALLMTSHAEAMPIALIEAMGVGVPIVTAPWAGASEMLDGEAAGFIARDWQPASIAHALSSALDDPQDARQRAARAGAKARAVYDIGAVARSHAQLYRSIITR